MSQPKRVCKASIKVTSKNQESIMKQYCIASIKSDPMITIKIPRKILQDLVLRAEENGQSIEIEFALRLARTLERDLEMIEEDNEIAYQALEMCKANPKLMDGIYEPFGSEEE